MAKVRTIPRNGLILEALLDGNVLDTNDGTKATLTATNVPYENTNVGYQYQRGIFNGSTSFVNAGNNLNLSTSFTLDVVAVPSSVSASQRIVSKWDGTNGYALYVGADGGTNGKIWFFININGTRFDMKSSGNDFTAGEEFRITVTVDLANKVGYVYKNNAQLVTNTWSQTSTITNSSSNFNVGRTTEGSGSQYFNGRLQSIRIWNYVLSEFERQSVVMEGKKLLAGKSYNDLMNGCVAYYDMRGDANDVIGGYNGTVTGATLTTDRFGNANNAYSFNGSSYKIATSSPIVASGNFSSLIWFKANSFPSGTSLTELWGNTTSTTGHYLDFYGNNGSPTMRFDNACTYATSNLSTGTWYCAICTYDSSTTSHSIYINGVSVASGNQSQGTATQNMGIGYNIVNNDRFFDGEIGEVAFFNRKLTADEAKAISVAAMREKIYPWYPNLPKSLQNGLALAYSGNASGTTAYDWSGNGNNGTLVGTPTFARRISSKGTVLNGSSQYLQFGDLINTSSPFSVTCYFYSSDVTNERCLASQWNDPASSNGSFQVQLYQGNVRFVTQSSSTTNILSCPVSTSRFYTVTGVYDGTNVVLYVNSSKYASSSVSTINNVTTNTLAGARYSSGTPTAYMSGNENNFLLHSRALSPIEAQMLHYSLYLK